MANEKETDARVAVVEYLWKDPESKRAIEDLLVRKSPESAHAIPGYVQRQQGEKILEEARAINEDTRKRNLEREQRDSLERARREIMDDPVLSIREDEIPEVERLMTDETIGPIGSHKAAAQLLRHQQREIASQGGMGSYSTMQVPGVGGAGGDEYKWLVPGVGNPAMLDRVTRERSEQMIRDFRTGNGKKWL